MSKEEFKVKPVELDQTIKNIVEAIDNGYKLQHLPDEQLDAEGRLEFSDSLILKPDYQREYRSTIEEESSIIESILVGIPIPPVFLCSTRIKGVQVLNVVDGQHRLFALYRFRKGEFKLTGLPLLKDYEGKKFSELPIEEQELIIGHKLPAFVFREFPGKRFELEVFNRYNKGTKNLTPQEIRNAVYSSPHNDYITKFVEKLYKSNSDPVLSEIYNVTKDRFLKKKVHEGIFSILYVLEFGIDESFKDSTTYATEYMKKKAELFSEQGEEQALRDENNMIYEFEKFNAWLKQFTKYTPYPLSKELYGISSKSYKFQTSMALILPALYNRIKDNEKWKDKEFDFIVERIRMCLTSSFLEDPDYTASSTNSREIARLVESFTLD
ncbi:Protein of unknown function DUF262 [Butyrivibrio proteoclasticus]|uniref:GmrSD restriction endonucleases N-terminal domain-containing protein n=1 Tax=Butyrivibrio proteoclasticus TaxID=43305 RepID=A0A1I5VI23_9FIRM|nr:DUF262 domain-containing protein [Butyrivibrio proteoclasticus]SFQ07198.1 Protein of unknown function DUF262 [Butyrivibrio proteoclasticus]